MRLRIAEFMPGIYMLTVMPSSLAESTGVLVDDVILSVYSVCVD